MVAGRRAEWFSDKLCNVCGATDDLQLDHRDRTTKVSHRIWSWAKERREAELAKCQALCVPCHKAKTRSEFSGWDHGATGYKKHGCRCEVCRAGNTEYRRQRRAMGLT